MNTMNLKQSETQNGASKQEPTWLSITVRSISNWIFDKKLEIKGLELRHKSEQTEGYKVLGTPYQVIKENGYWFTVIGKIRTSGDFETQKEAVKDAKRLDISKVMELIEIMKTAEREFNKNNKQNEK